MRIATDCEKYMKIHKVLIPIKDYLKYVEMNLLELGVALRKGN